MNTVPPPVPRAQRPTGAATIGMLYMIFGGLGLFGGLVGVAIVPLLANVSNEVAQNDPALEASLSMFSSPVFPLIMALAFVQAAMLAVGGYGLWTMKPWGRRIGETATWVYLAGTVITSGLSYFWIQDMTEAMSVIDGQSVPPEFQSFMNAMAAGSVVFNVILYGGLLVWALVYLRSDKVRAAYGE